MPQGESGGLQTMGLSCEKAMSKCAIGVSVKSCKPWGRHARGLCRKVP